VPCYQCGTRQADPEPGKSSPWRRGVVREHQVLICPACQPSVLADLSRCARCGSAHLIRRLDQVECLDCRLVRDAEPEPAEPEPAEPAEPGSPASGSPAPVSAAPGSPPGSPPPAAPPRPAGSGDLAAEVARALERVLGRR
jgi:hypothetical protein